jgi:hypothetical protein
MSRRPGLGSEWYNRFHSDAFPSDYLIHQGKKHPVPRFYINKLKEGNPVVFETIRKKRVLARELLKDDNTADRLFVKMEVKQSKIKSLARSL